MTAHPSDSILQQAGLLEEPTMAPTVGDVVNTFSSRLDGRNPLRLPNVVADAGVLGPFWIAAASVTGLAHLHHARTGQDSYDFAVAEDDHAVVVAVAHGLGSKPSSQVGSTLLARMTCDVLAGQSFDAILGSPLDSVALAVGAVNERFRSIRDLAFPHLADGSLSSTLAFCWIPRDPTSHRAIAGRVGDCGVFTLRGDACGAPFGRDDQALNVVSASLPSERPLERLELAELDLSDQAVLVLATDGLAEDVFGSPTVRSWLANCWSGPCGVYRMLEALRYRRRGSHDDRTALAVWLEPIDVPAETSALEPAEGQPPAPEESEAPCK